MSPSPEPDANEGSALEYAMIAGLVAMALIAGLTALSHHLEDSPGDSEAGSSAPTLTPDP